MKQYRLLLIVIALLGLQVFQIVNYFKHKGEKVVPNVEATKADSATVALLDSVASAYSDSVKLFKNKAENSRKVANKWRAKGGELQSEIDSLAKQYEITHTLPICDSILKLKDDNIFVLKNENAYLSSANEYLSLSLQKETKVIEAKDSIISSKKRLISVYQAQFESINCQSDYWRRHRFLKWLLRVRCNL